jgi:hypothetical protein
MDTWERLVRIGAGRGGVHLLAVITTFVNTAIIITISFALIPRRVGWAVEIGWRFRIQAGYLWVDEAVHWGVM